MMCGIAGFYHYNNARPTDFETLRRMTAVLRHRGPDGEGYFYEEEVGLGHRRLAIIDVERGEQPIYSSDGRYVLTFNGEIYNYLELRRNLADKADFRTDSDSETILEAYREWGLDAQSHLNGMWAFALWDREEQRLLVSRDRIGKKPLYYSLHGGRFVFGSELKCLFEAGIPMNVDWSITELFLSLGYLPAPYTFFSGISKLRPGHCLVLHGGAVREIQYWDLPEFDESRMVADQDEVHEQFEELFYDSVRLRMRSDVPYGAFLSGGMDSSSVLAAMTNLGCGPVRTYTVGARAARHDEAPIAAEVSRRFQTIPAVIYPDPNLSERTLEEFLERLAFHFDEPFADSSAIPTYQIAQRASLDVKMVLTGDGGDELLSGYPAYRMEGVAASVQSIPKSFWHLTSRFSGRVSRLCRGKVRYALNKTERYFGQMAAPAEERVRDSILGKVDLDVVRRLHERRGDDVISVDDFLGQLFGRCPYRDPFYRLMYFDLKVGLPDDILVKVDRMSMANGLEVRAPFLDFRLIEQMVKVDKSVKMDIWQTKKVLRHTIGRSLPWQVLQAKKRGFVIPMRDWLRHPQLRDALNRLSDSDVNLDRDTVRRMVRLHQTGAKDYGQLIWSLLLLSKSLDRLSA